MDRLELLTLGPAVELAEFFVDFSVVEVGLSRADFFRGGGKRRVAEPYNFAFFEILAFVQVSCGFGAAGVELANERMSVVTHGSADHQHVVAGGLVEHASNQAGKSGNDYQARPVRIAMLRQSGVEQSGRQLSPSRNLYRTPPQKPL